MRQEVMGFWDAVASAGPYANNLHLAPDTPHQHLITQCLQAVYDAFSDANQLTTLIIHHPLTVSLQA